MTIVSDNYHSPSTVKRVPVPTARRLPSVLKILPGIGLVGTVAGTAFLMRSVPGFAALGWHFAMSSALRHWSSPVLGSA